MSKFKKFKEAVDKQFSKISKNELFVTDISKDKLWETYLSSFPSGTNPIYKERTEHDCQCCKQFIRACGNVVSINDYNLSSIWDIDNEGVPEEYQVVASELSKLVKSKAVKDIFLHYEKNLGTDFNHQLTEKGDTIKWEHFHFKLLNKFVKNKDSIGTILSEKRSSKDVFKRALEEISIDSVETVLELIEQNSIYRGEEHKGAVEQFLKHKKEFDLVDNKDNYCWGASLQIGGASRIRNSAIGTLLVDISDGKGLNSAVKMFESKVAPQNYKRPTALITKGMIKNAQDKVQGLGIETALKRRFALIEDITINNILFADRSTKKLIQGDIFDDLIKEAPDKVKNLDKVEEVSIKTFIDTLLPKADSIELMLENKHSNNLMSLIAPEDSLSKNILKWDNNFSWAYNGEVADSMKERVKKAGGKVDGDFRFSIQWNDDDTKGQSDLDAWCNQPNGKKVYFSDMNDSRTKCALDVDITNPRNKVAVENIVIPVLKKIHDGEYKLSVHNFSNNGGNKGFKAEFEYNGQIHSYEYNKALRNRQVVVVAEFNLSQEKGIEFIKSLPSTTATKEVWGVNTNKFHKVSMIMNSPNHWNGNKTGNKHHFFILDDCKNPDNARGFFNEFLDEDLREHRKVFEVLGSKMKVEKSDVQLSGLGFSSTQRNSILCKITGSFTRIIKIKF